MDIRQFMKRKNISDSRSVEKNFRQKLENWGLTSTGEWDRKDKAFCERPFALHDQQPVQDKQDFDVAPT